MLQVRYDRFDEEAPITPPKMSDIMSVAPWKHALFTTYALSLSYFESEVLRPLLRAGCDDIWLISDAEGYRSSLLERRSAHVGQEYRLVPAALPRGVFHAKCIYLVGEDEDLLLVGSGNVTFGGHGRNVEVFEALRPEGSASAFTQFEQFLESIGSRPDIRMARRDWVDDFGARARSAAQRGFDNPNAPSLVHSVDEPVVEQLKDRLSPFGPCQSITVMSPYHDPDGGAVERLVRAVDASHAEVAVPSATKESPFPFAATSTWDRPVIPVQPVTPETRFIHAKWYEFECRDWRVLLTGSINATRKALTTSDNVELGVLRPLGLAINPIDWMPAPVPPFEAQSQLPSGLGSNELVYASFDRTEPHRLHGQLLTLQPSQGRWIVRLVPPDGESFSCEAETDDRGNFHLRDAALEALSQVPAVQIILTMGERQARGWVHNDMLLGMSSRRRLTAGALSRLMRREATDNDIEALLEYLSIQAEQHLNIFSASFNGQDTDKDNGTHNEIITVNLEDIAPIEKLAPEISGAGAADKAQDDQFHTAMAQLRRILLGHGRSRERTSGGGDAVAAGEDDQETENAQTPEQVAKALGLVEFERAITEMIDHPAARPNIRDGLLVMLLEVSMAMRLYRMGDMDGAHEFLSSWLYKACNLGSVDLQKKTALQQHIVTAAATLQALARTTTAGQTNASEIHDSLESYYGGPVNQQHAFSLLISDPQAGFAAALVSELAAGDLAAALRAIFSTTTRRQQLEDALSLAMAGKPIPTDWDVFKTPVGKRLLKSLQDPHPEKRVRKAPPGYRACAFDWMKFAPQEAGEFEIQRIGFCVHCKKFTVNTSP